VTQQLTNNKHPKDHGLNMYMLGAIQIIRDTLRGAGGVNQNVMCHFLSIFELNFTAKVFKKPCFM